MNENENTNATGSIGHSLLETFKSGNIVVRVWEKKVEENKVYYDFSISRQYFTSEGEPKYSSKMQQRDFDDLMYAVLDAKLFIREKVFELRSRNSKQD